jgi:AraC-like DNA-binding protein
MRRVTVAVAQPKKTVNPLNEAKKYVGQARNKEADVVFFPDTITVIIYRNDFTTPSHFNKFLRVIKENNSKSQVV